MGMYYNVNSIILDFEHLFMASELHCPGPVYCVAYGVAYRGTRDIPRICLDTAKCASLSLYIRLNTVVPNGT